LQRTIARQESRALWLSEGDAPTKFFHVQASARRRRNFIHSMEHEGHHLVAEDSKAAAIYEHFDSILGAAPSRSCSIAFDNMELPRLKLGHLCARFTEAEVRAAISSLPPDKAPGPDGSFAWILCRLWTHSGGKI
jgi:hypothetical protein